MNWYLKVFNDYYEFKGRARRSEYWMFLLYNFSFATILFIADVILQSTIKFFPFGWFYILYAVMSIVPNIAVTVRRLHDIGKSGWMILLCLIPFVGGIWLFILLLFDSDSEENDYGENPKMNSNVDDNSNGDSIIYIVLTWMMINVLLYQVTPLFVESDIYTTFYKSIGVISTLLWSIIPISLSFAIRNKNKRIVFLVLGSLYFIYALKDVFVLLKEYLFNWYLFS